MPRPLVLYEPEREVEVLLRIFIDESGNFTPPPASQPHMCSVTTLAVSESSLERLLALHAQLVADWKPPDGEVKGRNLNERNFQRVLTALKNLDVVPTIVAIDMALQTDAFTTAHKAAQVTKLRNSVAGSEFLPSFRESVHDLASRVEQLSNQLYIQSLIQTAAIARTIRVATMHYAQTEPLTLGSFVWRIDAKDRTIQECERLWTDLAKPFLQSMFLERPLLMVSDGRFDYSAMAPFQNPDQDAPPAHLAAARRRHSSGPFQTSDLRKLIVDLSFQDSMSSAGIQFADVLASVFCRACNGRLRERGWERLGAIMIKHPEDGQAVSFVTLTRTTARTQPGRLSYRDVVHRIEAEAKDFAVDPRP